MKRLSKSDGMQMNLKAIERDKWFQSEEGQRCTAGKTEGQYLRNRVELAWCAGWDAASANNSLIIGALDTLGTALTNHGHVWTDGERTIYEQAMAAAQEQQRPREDA